jgi:hypothetical protein
MNDDESTHGIRNTALQKNDQEPRVLTHINHIQHAMRAFDLLSAMALELVHQLQPV